MPWSPKVLHGQKAPGHAYVTSVFTAGASETLTECNTFGSVVESEKSMKTHRMAYGAPPKSAKRQATKHHWIRYEELTRRYLPLLGGTVWGTYTTLFTFRNRKTNQCFPRYQTIAERRGLSRRSIIRHVNKLTAFGLIEKAHRFYDDAENRECGGQRSNCYWFVSLAPDCVTPGGSEPNPITRSPSNKRISINLAEEKESPKSACSHPWGEPLGYPHSGFWRCCACGELYKR